MTAKIRWLTKADEDADGEGRPRWIHCTPLLGHSGAVGVWMIVLVDEENSTMSSGGRRFRNAPPVASNINGKEWDAGYAREQGRERNRLNAYDAEDARKRGAAPREWETYPYHGVSRDISRSNSFVAQGGNRRDRSTSGHSHSSGAAHVLRGANGSEFSFQLK